MLSGNEHQRLNELLGRAVFSDPANVGQAEYTALVELLESAADGLRDQPPEEIAAHLLVVLDELDRWAATVRQDLRPITGDLVADDEVKRDWVAQLFDTDDEDAAPVEAWLISDVTEREAGRQAEAETPDDGMWQIVPAAPWVAAWSERGDDMACPGCGKRQIETQNSQTVCRSCGWRADNPLAL